MMGLACPRLEMDAVYRHKWYHRFLRCPARELSVAWSLILLRDRGASGCIENKGTPKSGEGHFQHNKGDWNLSSV